MQRFAGVTGTVLIIVSAFFAGHIGRDGNPIGYHLSGYARMGQQVSSLTSCSISSPCYLAIDIFFNTAAAPPQALPHCSSSCFTFQNLPTDPLQLDHVTFDGAYAGNYTVWVNGSIQGSPNAPPRPSSPH